MDLGRHRLHIRNMAITVKITKDQIEKFFCNNLILLVKLYIFELNYQKTGAQYLYFIEK